MLAAAGLRFLNLDRDKINDRILYRLTLDVQAVFAPRRPFDSDPAHGAVVIRAQACSKMFEFLGAWQGATASFGPRQVDQKNFARPRKVVMRALERQG
ncbi:MAG TPA: hypothetical protein VEL28_10150 [Candidatus Binatia bacterium]|nr:hypothetical protein [Candidatus Binatia bacterium]